MSFSRDRQRAVRRSTKKTSGAEGIQEDELEGSIEVESSAHSWRTMSREDHPPGIERDDGAGKGRVPQGGSHHVYEEQLQQLQEQLEATLIGNMEKDQYIKELEEDRSGKKQYHAQKKELEKLTRENEELRERLKDLTSGVQATAERNRDSKRLSLPTTCTAPTEGESPSVGAATPLRRLVRSAQVATWDWLCQLASDFSEDAVRSEGGLKDETTPLTVKSLKSNLTRLGKASKPLRELMTFVVDVLHFKNKAETLVVFLVYMYCVWNGWVIQLLLLLAILKLTLNYLYESHLAEQFGFYQDAPTEESDADMGLGDTFSLVKQVAQSVQNIAGQVADALEKLTNLVRWHPAKVTAQLYRTLWIVFVFSLFLPNGYVLSFLGLFLGVKLFVIDSVYRNYPKVKDRYDSVAKMYRDLLTREQLLADQSLTGDTTMPALSKKQLLDAANSENYCAVTSEDCPDFCAKFGLGLDEQPLAGWHSGRRCTLMDREKPLIGSKGGTLYLTHSCLCFESKSCEKIVVHLADVTSVTKSKPFSILPGSGMAIEITQKVVDKALLLGAILNRDQVFDAILEQGFLLDLPWGQDRKQALQNDPPTSAAAEDEGLDAKLNESSF